MDYLEWVSAVVMGFANAPGDGETLTDEEEFFDDWWSDLEHHRWEFVK